ncbi:MULTISPECIES: DUF3515 family protein [unclassified Streptomyces]|uniref:DUF3515 family protein n=1 Tax=unclassified Streptomyces TaxID=2593676 RepID=UPI002E2E3604|nr:DUF3515 family protein [Streptomyces sp. NBC_01429]
MPFTQLTRRTRLTRRTGLALATGACVLAAGAAFAVHALTGTDAGVPPAKESGAPHCLRVTEDAPASLGGLSRRDNSLPGIAVWGDRGIVLRCGVTPPGPSGDPCFAVDGVDWVIDQEQSTPDRKVIVTYGRSPATQVIFGGGGKTDAALVGLSRLVAPIPQTSQCLAAN